MAELAARYLMGNGVNSLIVTNRSFDKAIQVADLFNGKAIFFEEIESYILEVDIIITSTASMDFVVTHDLVKNSLRKRRNRPLFFIDIAVPRDVDPSVNVKGEKLAEFENFDEFIEILKELGKGLPRPRPE